MIVMRLHSGAKSHFVTRMPEWGLSLILLGMAAQSLRGSEAFEAAAAYHELAKLVDQGSWGAVALTISVVWLVALTINGVVPVSRRWTPWARSLCAFGACAWWATNALFFFMVSPGSYGLVNNIGHAFLALASSIIVAREVGAEDGNVRKCRLQSPPRIG